MSFKRYVNGQKVNFLALQQIQNQKQKKQDQEQKIKQRMMIISQDTPSDTECEELKRNQVPVSNRPRFINELMIKHRNRKRTQAKRKTNKLKQTNQLKQQAQNFVSRIAISYKQVEDELQKKVTYVHGNRIEGTWKNGNLHGDVIIQYQSGQFFEGKYVNGIRVQGLVKFKDGTEYRGGFLKDIFHGAGTLKDPSGRVIICQWEQGEPMKKAKIEYPSGQIYFGQIQNLKKHGTGHLFFRNGSKYIGNFVKGAITGYGRYYEKDQMVAEGIWKNGVLQIEESVSLILTETLKNQYGFQMTLKSIGDLSDLKSRSVKRS